MGVLDKFLNFMRLDDDDDDLFDERDYDEEEADKLINELEEEK